MTINDAMKYLENIDQKYQSKEDKNYYLVHGLSEVLKYIEDDDLELLKDNLFKKFSVCAGQYLSFLDYLVVASKEDILSMKQVKDTSRDSDNHKEIHSIVDFYYQYDENLIYYIKGHLFLEYIMNTISEKALNKRKNTFSKKIYLLYNNNLISEKEKDLLVAINKLRNKIAHDLDFKLTFDELFCLVKISAECGVDYSDHTIFDNRKLSEEWYGIDGIINELFPNLFCHLLHRNKKYFNDMEINDYMS